MAKQDLMFVGNERGLPLAKALFFRAHRDPNHANRIFRLLRMCPKAVAKGERSFLAISNGGAARRFLKQASGQRPDFLAL